MHLQLSFLGHQYILNLFSFLLHILHFWSIVELHQVQFHSNRLQLSKKPVIFLFELSKLADKLRPFYLSVVTFFIAQSIDFLLQLCNVLYFFPKRQLLFVDIVH